MKITKFEVGNIVTFHARKREMPRFLVKGRIIDFVKDKDGRKAKIEVPRGSKYHTVFKKKEALIKVSNLALSDL